MQLDDFLQTIKIENQNQDEASKAEATKVIHAMLFDYDENEVRVDFLGAPTSLISRSPTGPLSPRANADMDPHDFEGICGHSNDQ